MNLYSLIQLFWKLVIWGSIFALLGVFWPVTLAILAFWFIRALLIRYAINPRNDMARYGYNPNKPYRWHLDNRS